MGVDELYLPGIRDPEVLKAMSSVPRHLFVPEHLSGRAYADSPLPIGGGQTISQPYIVAYMTEKLRIAAGDKILEIGTGSGYQAAVLSRLTDRVFSVEILMSMAFLANKNLSAAGIATVTARTGDGYEGWPEEAPFDGIIVTAAAKKIPQPLVEQLAPGGRLVIPVGAAAEVQELVLVENTRRGPTTTRLLAVRFVPMTGQVRR